MKVLVFTEGTIFTHEDWIGLAREKIVERVRAGQVPAYAGTTPIGGAVEKIRAWQRQGANIVYMTSRRADAVAEVRNVLERYDFPKGQLFFRREDEEYADVAERIMPDVLIEDDCESIGGEIQMTYPHIKPGLKERIKSIVVKEFGGIDYLPNDLLELANWCGAL